MHPYNHRFDLSNHVGSVLSEGEYHCLLKEGKIYETRCMHNGKLCVGTIIADNYDQAILIAKQRGFNEEVLGMRCGSVPYDSADFIASEVSQIQKN